ncbi:MAG: phage major capsid protein, partial [Eubacteriales bacterium]|nr:phage major capsid protein [Eubacteriales bacterium]
LYSKLIPVSKVLGKAERAGLLTYINRWFVKNAIITENQKIFAALKDGITPITYLTFDQLKTAAQTGLDTSVWYDGVIATNQSGYNHLSLLKTEDGKYLMQPLITEPTKKGIDINGTIVPVKVYDNKFLPNVSGKAPIFFGSTKAGCYMIELGSTEFNSDDSYLFGKNQKALMILEGFDVIGADKDAYNYGLLDIKTYDVTFTVKIGTTAQADIVIECNGLTGTTDVDGKAVLKLTNGVFNYTAKGATIKDFAGKANVAGANVPVAVAATAAE